MMTLKYPVPAVRPPDLRCREPSLFALPPQGAATLSEPDARALAAFCSAIRERLPGPVRFTVHPHRIGSRTSVALHLEGRLGQSIDVLITVTGITRWPQPDEYSHPRWYLTVPDAADVVYLLFHLSDLCERFQVNG
ncbi:acetyltransferase [Serratia sp. CY85251]|uniref:acetyltransferase n=1 Tax=Serratia sp. CY85251 TaxID=3383696 RepID=UPI003FA117E9